MPKTYFMYIPWGKLAAGEYKYKDTKTLWQNQLAGGPEEHRKQFSIVYKDTTGTPFKFIDDGNEVTIYVRGHGSVGGGEVHKQIDRATGFGIGPAEAKDIVSGIISKGLKENFSGKIKFYNCHSAEGELSFAAQCASFFRKKSFNNAQFFGYTGEVSGFYQTPGDYVNSTKQRDQNLLEGIEDRQSVHKWVIIQGTLVRASKARSQF